MTQITEIATALTQELQDRGYWADCGEGHCTVHWKDYAGTILDTEIVIWAAHLVVSNHGQPSHRVDLDDPLMIDKILEYLGPPDA